MRKRTLLLGAFVLAGVSAGFSQELGTSTTKPVRTEATKTRTAIAPKPLTAEQIETELKALENVLVVNRNDASFRKDEVLARIEELKALKQELNR